MKDELVYPRLFAGAQYAFISIWVDSPWLIYKRLRPHPHHHFNLKINGDFPLDLGMGVQFEPDSNLKMKVDHL